jgi:PAS domain S-box-containing protein
MELTSARRKWRLLGRCLLIATGLAVAAVVFLVARGQERDRAMSDFRRRAEFQAEALEASLEKRANSLVGMQRFLQFSPLADETHFQAWAGSILAEQPEVQVIEWAPRVSAARRAAHEQTVAAELGVPFQISEWKEVGTRVPAGMRAEYFPISRVAPRAGNEGVLGLDVLVGQTAGETWRAAEAADLVSSGFVTLSQTNRPGLILILPVYDLPLPETPGARRAALRGCLRVVMRAHELVAHGWEHVSFDHMETLVLDAALRGTNAPALLFPSGGGSVQAGLAGSFRGAFHHEMALQVGGHPWIILFRPTPGWWAEHLTWFPAGLGASVVLLTLLLLVYTRALSRRTDLVEQTVAERTTKLATANKALGAEIAERRRTEERLVEAQRIGRIGSWVSDPRALAIVWSDEVYRIFGKDRESFQPTRPAFLECVHPDDRAGVERTVRDALAQTTPYHIEHRIVRSDGQVRTVIERAELIKDASGQVVQFQGTVQDITDRKRIEDNLDAERNLLAGLIASLPDIIFVKDAQGRFVRVNNPEFFGARRVEEIIGKTDADLLPAELAATYQADDRRVMESGELLYNREEPFMSSEGERRWMLTTKAPWRDSEGRIIGLIGISRDITQRRRRDEERQNMERKFQETQKLESLGVLAGGIAHDFNNLLTGILGNASLARMDLPPESPVQPYLEQIESSSQRAADLCRQMLAYSGKGRFIIQRLDLSALVQETTHLLHLSISKKSVLHLKLAPDLPPVMGDATELRQIVMNLVMNASEAIGERSGNITIRTGTFEASAEYLSKISGAGNATPGRYVVLEVADDGCGMTPEVQARIFDPFFTTKFTGRGLGLAAVLGIVRGHKGGLEVTSIVGKGTTFRLLMPAATPLPREITTAPTARQWRASGTALIVDDEGPVRAVAARMLRSIGFEVLVAEDGLQALDAFRAHARNVTVVLLDLTMPRMDGEETFRELRKLNPAIPILLMSGFSEPAAAGRFVGKGLSGFVQKPFTPSQLREKLAALFNPDAGA